MSIAQSLENVGFLYDFSVSVLVYPIVLSIHLTCIALFGGMILMTNLRLLGITFNRVTITEMITNLRPWKRLGGTIMIATGLLLATSEATKYAPNPYFWTKMIILCLIGVHGFVFRPIVYNRTEELDRSKVIPAKVKVAAVLSLLLWTGMFTMGRLIAYWEAPAVIHKSVSSSARQGGRRLWVPPDAPYSQREPRPWQAPPRRAHLHSNPPKQEPASFMKGARFASIMRRPVPASRCYSFRAEG